MRSLYLFKMELSKCLMMIVPLWVTILELDLILFFNRIPIWASWTQTWDFIIASKFCGTYLYSRVFYIENNTFLGCLCSLLLDNLRRQRMIYVCMYACVCVCVCVWVNVCICVYLYWEKVLDDLKAYLLTSVSCTRLKVRISSLMVNSSISFD